MDFFITLLVTIAITSAFHYWKHKYSKTQKVLLESINNYEKQLKETKEKYTISLWTVYQPTQEELQRLAINKEAIDIVVKTLTYYTAKATDALRYQTDTNKLLTASWNVSWFHEMLVFFWKLQQQEIEKK